MENLDIALLLCTVLSLVYSCVCFFGFTGREPLKEQDYTGLAANPDAPLLQIPPNGKEAPPVRRRTGHLYVQRKWWRSVDPSPQNSPGHCTFRMRWFFLEFFRSWKPKGPIGLRDQSISMRRRTICFCFGSQRQGRVDGWGQGAVAPGLQEIWKENRERGGALAWLTCTDRKAWSPVPLHLHTPLLNDDDLQRYTRSCNSIFDICWGLTVVFFCTIFFGQIFVTKKLIFCCFSVDWSADTDWMWKLVFSLY